MLCLIIKMNISCVFIIVFCTLHMYAALNVYYLDTTVCQRSVSDLTCRSTPKTLYRSKINWIDILKLEMIGFDNESILDIRNSFPDLLIVHLINNRATLTCAQVLTNAQVTVEITGHICDVSFHTFSSYIFTPQDMNVYWLIRI